jgi:1-acyl-sn-glycerol-3-phosphate acyltransferase
MDDAEPALIEPKREIPLVLRFGADIPYEAAKFLAWFMAVPFLNIRHYGRENIPGGGALLASNHQCFLDPAFVSVGLCRPIYFFARASAFDIPLVGPVIRRTHAFPVVRGHGDTKAYRKTIGLLSSGQRVLVFPEGTRTCDGRIGEMKPGVVSMAQRAGCPIVPVAIRGGFSVWPRHRKLPGMGRVRVAFGAPLGAGRGKSDAAAAAERLDREIRRLFDELGSRFPSGPTVW